MIKRNTKSRIVHKHDIEENWLKAVNFIPKQGEIIVYDIDDTYTYSRFKIGDGKTNINDLPFYFEQVLPSDIGDLKSTVTELNYMSGVTDNVQSQLDNKTQVQMTSENLTEILQTLKILKLTQEEYDTASKNGSLEDDTLYLTPNQEIDLSNYATIDQLNNKADNNHKHDEYITNDQLSTKSDIEHKHDEYATIDQLNNKADSEHSHDDIYSTKTEINNCINASLDESKSYSDANLNVAKTYTDNAVSQKSQIKIITWEADD
jgi:hypothetical protein